MNVIRRTRTSSDLQAKILTTFQFRQIVISALGCLAKQHRNKPVAGHQGQYPDRSRGHTPILRRSGTDAWFRVGFGVHRSVDCRVRLEPWVASSAHAQKRKRRESSRSLLKPQPSVCASCPGPFRPGSGTETADDDLHVVLHIHGRSASRQDARTAHCRSAECYVPAGLDCQPGAGVQCGKSNAGTLPRGRGALKQRPASHRGKDAPLRIERKSS